MNSIDMEMMHTTDAAPRAGQNLTQGSAQTSSGQKPTQKPAKPWIMVKELSKNAHWRLRKHFLALNADDRLLRFGSVLPDELIINYVEGINFDRDTVFGVYDGRLKLVGVGHLAFAPREQLPVLEAATSKERIAEFGVSVSASGRGMGVGTKLFERAAIRCRNADIDTLYMHCLSSNQVMMHIAKKAGMEIQRDYGEADAYLRLLPANPVSVLQEAVEEQVASIDYTFKANARAAVKWFENLPSFRRDE